jgi:adenylate cyclase
MRREIARQVVADVIREVETACGSSIPAARLNQSVQRVSQLLADAVELPRPTEHKQVSILLSDLRGFTALAERLKPTDVIGLLNRYFTRMCEIIVAYGGTIDKFMGDGIMVLFGAPDTGRDDLARAIACAVEMQSVMSQVNEVNAGLGMPQIFMGIGINTGEVVAANVGSELHREYTVIGDNVNLASRLGSNAKAGQILVSRRIWELVKESFDVRAQGPLRVKGKDEEVEVFEVVGARQAE